MSIFRSMSGSVSNFAKKNAKAKLLLSPSLNVFLKEAVVNGDFSFPSWTGTLLIDNEKLLLGFPPKKLDL